MKQATLHQLSSESTNTSENLHDSDYEMGFFMELLGVYKSQLARNGLNESEIVQKLADKKQVNKKAYFNLIGEYEAALIDSGIEEDVRDSLVGGYIQAYGIFSETFHQDILPEHLQNKALTEGEWKLDKSNDLRNQLIEWLEGAEAGENHEAEKSIRATLDKMVELERKAE